VARVLLVLAAVVLLPAGLVRAARAPGPHGRPAQLRVLDALLPRLEPAVGIDAVATNAGDAWVADPQSGQITHLDGRDGRVLARIAIGGRVALAAGKYKLWAVRWGGRFWRTPNGPLLRIDPRRNRVLDRIPLQLPSGEQMVAFGVLASGRAVWVWGPRHVLRFDAGTGALVQDFVVDDRHGELTGAALAGATSVAAITADGHLLRIDAAYGQPEPGPPTGIAGAELRAIADGRLLATEHGTLYAVDPYTGKTEWRRRLGFHVGSVLASGGVLLAHGAALHDPGDRLWALDAATGRVLASMVLPTFGTSAMASLRGALWITAVSGDVVVVPRWLARRFLTHAYDSST
jgi:outer membrane protein assembly factor BamB